MNPSLRRYSLILDTKISAYRAILSYLSMLCLYRLIPTAQIISTVVWVISCARPGCPKSRLLRDVWAFRGFSKAGVPEEQTAKEDGKFKSSPFATAPLPRLMSTTASSKR